MGSTAKTNAIRLLERLGVTFGVREYEVDPDDLAAETVARKVGLPAEQVFNSAQAKTPRDPSLTRHEPHRGALP